MMKKTLGITLMTVLVGALTIPFLWDLYLQAVQAPVSPPATEQIDVMPTEIISRTIGVLA